MYSHIRGFLGRTVLVWVRPLRKVYDQTDAVNDPKKGLNRRMWLSQDIAHKIPLSSTVDEHYGFYARGRDKRPEKLQIPAIADDFVKLDYIWALPRKENQVCRKKRVRSSNDLWRIMDLPTDLNSRQGQTHAVSSGNRRIGPIPSRGRRISDVVRECNGVGTHKQVQKNGQSATCTRI